MSDHSQWLRGLAEKGGKGVVNNIDARCLGRIADEIDHLRPYVDAFRREEDRADKLGRDVDELREQLVRKDAALNHARVRFECLTDYFEEIADETMQAMSSVDADRMIAALTDEHRVYAGGGDGTFNENEPDDEFVRKARAVHTDEQQPQPRGSGDHRSF